MNKLLEKAKEELGKLLPPTIFFFLALHLVALFRLLMLKAAGIAPGTPLSIAVAALIMGKAVLLADMLPFINRYPDRPLAYNIAWKTAIYVLVALLIHYLERLIGFWREVGGFSAANETLLAEIVWPHFWAIQLLLFLLIFMYCSLHELIRVIGKDKARQMFFGPLPPVC